jgi:protein TonB
MRVGGEVHAPVILSKIDINFEECVRRREPVGMPIIEAVIDESGRIQRPRLLKPLHPCAERAVMSALKEWRFMPATYRGRAVPVIYNMTVFIHYR